MFKFDCECHMLPSAEDVNYFPLYKRSQDALRYMGRRVGRGRVHGITDPELLEKIKTEKKRRLGRAPGESGDALVEKMDETGVDMACVLPESFLAHTYGARMMSTNGWLARELEKYPDRLVGVCNVGPMLYRGMKEAIWELEYLVKEMNFKAVKFYPPDDTHINNRELWPYYEKIQKLGVPLFVHVGFSWMLYGRSEYCAPWLLEDVCVDFPELTILAYHMGYPFTDALNLCASKYRNLYIGTSLLPGFCHGLSKKSQIMMGEAIMWAGIDKIVWGTDLGANIVDVAFLERLQISEEVQRDYGFPPISEADRAKWAGLNLAGILNITPPNTDK
ncbi:MAG: amidohydrolase family protein [Deltaproteobacteria bacterium]|nr:amidohydrolase family protein [Deltaproteobacteria bacterium]